MSISIADINLSNDLVFGEVMRQPENVKPFLEAVLEKKIAEITYIEKQQDIKDGIHLHGIRLDVSLADQAGTQYDLDYPDFRIIPINLSKESVYRKSK